jgi:hypothetical protein
MKKYNAPTCDIVNVATDELMTIDGMSIRIFDQNAGIIGNDMLITDGSEILTNHNKLWDDETEEEDWR